MNKEQAFFLQILSDHLGERETSPQPELDWNTINHLARSHQVEGIVAQQCHSILPHELLSHYDKALGATIFYYANREVAMKEVEAALQDAAISFFTVKGFAVAEYYPIPALRTMGDCDVIVHRKDMPSAIGVMRKLGYQGIDNEKAHDWECVRNGMLFEVHDWLVCNDEHASDPQKQFFNRYEQFAAGQTLDWSFQFLYLLMHLRKHFMNGGVGIRQFMDLAVIIQNGPELRWGWIEKKLKELELLKFSQVCFALLEQWFGIQAPTEYYGLDDAFYTQITEKILANGVFGFDDESNKGNHERNVLIRSGKPLLLKRVSMLMGNAFPSYSYMRTYPGCGYVDGRPYLLPIAWLHRYILYFKRKNRTTISGKIADTLSPRAQIDAQREFLEKMGL